MPRGKFKDDSARFRLPKGQAALNAKWQMYKHDAKRRGLEFHITKEQFRELSQKNCYYCGAVPYQKVEQKSYNGFAYYNGLDRVNNSIGYFIDNIVTCCWVCNNMKAQMSKDQFLAHISKIVNRRLS